jgi:hypothetical protein
VHLSPPPSPAVLPRAEQAGCSAPGWVRYSDPARAGALGNAPGGPGGSGALRPTSGRCGWRAAATRVCPGPGRPRFRTRDRGRSPGRSKTAPGTLGTSAAVEAVPRTSRPHGARHPGPPMKPSAHRSCSGFPGGTAPAVSPAGDLSSPRFAHPIPAPTRAAARRGDDAEFRLLFRKTRFLVSGDTGHRLHAGAVARARQVPR